MADSSINQSRLAFPNARRMKAVSSRTPPRTRTNRNTDMGLKGRVPADAIDMTATTNSHSRRGLMLSQGSTVRSGSKGRMTKADTARISRWPLQW